MPLKVKICGMRDPANIGAAAALGPDYMGFIFYGKSPRYVGAGFSPDWSRLGGVVKTAVFVDEPLDSALEIIGRLGFEAAQLHGSESPEYCRQVQQAGVAIIKAFGIAEGFDFGLLEAYAPVCDYFMFDAKTSAFGGSGQTFPWDLLRRYSGSKPFFLSGGLDLGNLSAAMDAAAGLPLYALDLNSRFELAPGLKDTGKVKEAIRLIKHIGNEGKK
ncbi:MAG TPA: phosphoribosylanthranilate isomerase [Anseongella sp.]|nr:phosphoribosylanthranilate isomerase [Anseongella sp.]